MNDNKKVIKEIISYVCVILVVILVKIFIVSPIRVNGNSMYNTLYNKDIMILNEAYYYFNDIKRLDIVVVDQEKELIIKRVIGLPGDEIICVDGDVFVNEKKLNETYTHSVTEDFEKVKLGKDEYFVMGDNRSVSIDSRVYGSYHRKDIKGKASLTIYPFNRFGFKK